MYDQLRADVSVFENEELDLIACAFKMQLKEIREAIKGIEIIESK